MRDIVAAADLLVGAACPGCGVPALGVCPTCARAVRPRPFGVETARWAQHLDVVAAGRHHGVLRQVVIDWKERGRFPLTQLLAHHLATAVAAGEAGEAGGALSLVPIPTSWSARWRRGDDLVLSLARAAAGLLAEVGHDVTVDPVLSRVRWTADQSRLGAEDRARNLSGAFALERRRGVSAGRTTVIVDDIVTTGSTLAEAARALAAQGCTIQHAAVIAATPP